MRCFLFPVFHWPSPNLSPPLPLLSILFIQATWNMSMLQTQDIVKSVQAAVEKQELKNVTFSKL